MAQFEQALGEQQMTEVLTILWSSYDGKIIIVTQMLVICVDRL